MEKRVGGEEEQVGAVAPRHGVEDQLPRALRHLGGIFGQQPAPLCQRLRRHNKEPGKQEVRLQDVYRTSCYQWRKDFSSACVTTYRMPLNCGDVHNVVECV